METSALEQLACCGEGTEVWWDSSPLIYAKWRQEFPARVGSEWPELPQLLDALFHPEGAPYGYLRGATTNQPITLQALEADPARWREHTLALAADNPGADAGLLARLLFRDIVAAGSRLLLGMFEESGKRYGYICGQVDPRANDDVEAMVEYALALYAASPNVMIKMPGTDAGIEGVRRLTAKGIATTTTLSFTVPQLVAVAEAVEAGLRLARQDGVDLSRCRATGVMMLGRFEDHPEFKRQATEAGIELSPADLRWAGIAVMKRAYAIYKQRRYSAKLLAASMRLGPDVDGRQRIWHLEKLAGMDAVLTIFPNIIEAFLLAYRGDHVCSAVDEAVPAAVLERLLRVPYFRQAYEEDGLKPGEFASYPPVVATADAFTKSMQAIEKHVAEWI
ncbi:MAG: transaldolase family protein [Anaerolineae bacterium]